VARPKCDANPPLELKRPEITGKAILTWPHPTASRFDLSSRESFPFDLRRANCLKHWLGFLSDRVGRRPLLTAFAVTAVFTAYPAMSWLVEQPNFAKLLTVELWLSFIYAGYNGAMVVHLTKIVPVAVRTAGFSLAYSLATTIGGSTPAIVTFLIHETGNRAMPGAWLSVAAIVALMGVYVSRPRAAVVLAQERMGA
jgi:MFS family permease